MGSLNYAEDWGKVDETLEDVKETVESNNLTDELPTEPVEEVHPPEINEIPE